MLYIKNKVLDQIDRTINIQGEKYSHSYYEKLDLARKKALKKLAKAHLDYAIWLESL